MIESTPYEYQSRPRELVSSSGFSVEYDPRVTDQELKDDIISYLGEYRFQIPKFEYELIYSDGMLRDSHRNESMEIKAQRSVKERVMRGESTSREASEVIGLQFLDKQLESAQVGNSIVWASPPGAKEEGYGDYGFFYVGRIKRSIENKKQIQMAAFRVEEPTMNSFEDSFKLLTDVGIEAKTPEDYLKFPVVIGRELPEEYVVKTLSENFTFKNSARNVEIFDIAMANLNPMIDNLIVNWSEFSVEEKKKMIHALENKSLQIKKELEEGNITVYESNQDFKQFVNTYGYEPPKVAGSCPIKSSGLNSLGSNSVSSFMESEGFTCPNCGHKPKGPIGNQCPKCKITKEQYTQKSGQQSC